jgi:hypothetical protein
MVMKHIFLWVFLVTQGTATVDIITTTQHLNQAGLEHDPLAKPFTNLPRPAYIAAGEVGAAGVSFIGWKMKHSKHKWVRKIWWVPQAATISGNSYGSIYSARH